MHAIAHYSLLTVINSKCFTAMHHEYQQWLMLPTLSAVKYTMADNDNVDMSWACVAMKNTNYTNING